MKRRKHRVVAVAFGFLLGLSAAFAGEVPDSTRLIDLAPGTTLRILPAAKLVVLDGDVGQEKLLACGSTRGYLSVRDLKIILGGRDSHSVRVER